MNQSVLLAATAAAFLAATPAAQDIEWFRQARPLRSIGKRGDYIEIPRTVPGPGSSPGAPGNPEGGGGGGDDTIEYQSVFQPLPYPCNPNTFFHPYAPPEVGAPHPSQVLTVFLPKRNPAPSERFPVILHSPASVFSQGLYPPCLDPPCGANAPRAGFLLRALVAGWAVVSVGTVGHNSWPTCDQLEECWFPGVGNAGPDPGCSGQGSCWDPNLWYEPDGDPSSPWNDFNYFYSEKDFTWARQYVANMADELYLDNDRVVVCGTSTGAHLAAFVAYGPDRSWASTEPEDCLGSGDQVEQDTRVAGAILFEPVAWLGAASSVASPPFAAGLAGAHWPKCTPDHCGDASCSGTEFGEGIFGQNTIDDVCPTILAAGSTSTWIRDNAPLVPTFVASGDGLTTDFARDGDLFPDDYDRDGGSSPANDPLLAFPESPALHLHDAWHALTIMQDLMDVDASFHGQRSSLYLRADTNWGYIPNSLAPGIGGGADPAGPEDVPLVRGEFGCNCDGSRPDSCGDTAPLLCTSIENEELAPILVNWLNVQFCSVEATTAFRNAGTNPASYAVTPPVLGGVSQATVTTTPHSMAAILAFDNPANITLAAGQRLLMIGPNELFNTGAHAGPVANIPIPIPASAALQGKTMSTQAILFGSTAPFSLSNAQDWVLGCE